MPILPALLQALTTDKVKVVDLTHTLSAETPALVLPDPFVNLIDFSLETVSEYNEPGPFWRHANIHTGEHIGTHLDAPIHWISGREGHDVASIPPARLVGPAVVLDFVAQSEENPDFLIDIADVEAWEKENGAFEPNTWALFRTGWDQYGDDAEAFRNADESGSHTPGFTAAAAEWLANREELSGVGVETVGIDAGRGAELDPPFPMHYHLLGHDKYGITSLQNLQHLPARGAVIVVSPLPIVGGTGSPTRVFALVETEEASK
ncbi:MAG: cyclase family protein [Galactobacter sp.]